MKQWLLQGWWACVLYRDIVSYKNKHFGLRFLWLDLYYKIIYCFADFFFRIGGDNNEESGSRARLIPPPGLSFYGRYPLLHVDLHDEMQGISQYNFVKDHTTEFDY